MKYLVLLFPLAFFAYPVYQLRHGYLDDAGTICIVAALGLIAVDVLALLGL